MYDRNNCGNYQCLILSLSAIRRRILRPGVPVRRRRGRDRLLQER